MRLAEAAAAAAPAGRGRRGGGVVVARRRRRPPGRRRLDPLADPADDPRAIRRPLLIGGALTSAAISLAGAAFVAWRLRPAAGRRRWSARRPRRRPGRGLA